VIEGKELSQPPRVGRLDSLQGVRVELVRIYKEARRGTLASSEATRLTYILQVIAKVLEQSDLEARIERLEGTTAAAHEERKHAN
jgi:hypothetical protein